VAVTPDGQYAVSASDDKTLKVWDLGRGSELATLSVGSPLLCCAVCPRRKNRPSRRQERRHPLPAPWVGV